MSMQDRLKERIKNKPSKAHTELIGDGKVNRKKKFEDRYTRATFYIDNDLLEMIQQEAGDEKGEKTRIINDALRRYFSS